jgi:hypothetical protein
MCLERSSGGESSRPVRRVQGQLCHSWNVPAVAPRGGDVGEKLVDWEQGTAHDIHARSPRLGRQVYPSLRSCRRRLSLYGRALAPPL